MEKIMIFGFAIWFGLFMSAAPTTMRNDSQKVGTNAAVQTNPGVQKAGNQANRTDNLKSWAEHAILWHDPR